MLLNNYSHPVAEAEVEVLGVDAMPSLSGDAADDPGVFVGLLNLNAAVGEWIKPWSCTNNEKRLILMQFNFILSNHFRMIIIFKCNKKTYQNLYLFHKNSFKQLTERCLRCSRFLSLGSIGIGSLTSSTLGHICSVVHQADGAAPGSCSWLEHISKRFSCACWCDSLVSCFASLSKAL